jgi:Ca2+-binding RTX toxin-like protein
MAEGPVSSGTSDNIARQIQFNWPDDPETFRKWYQTEVSVFIGDTRAPADANNDEIDGWTPMGANQLTAARDAFTMWDELIGINLTIGNDSGADITFAYSATTNDNGSYCSPDLGSMVSDDIYEHYEIDNEYIWMSTDPVAWDELTEALVSTVGGRGFLTFLHEIGHSLGLSHPGPYDASDETAPDYGDDATFLEDSGQYTIMSYFGDHYIVGSGWAPPDKDTPQPKGDFVYWQTPTMYDIDAAQQKYGADLTTRTEGTIYGYNYNGPAQWAKIYDFSQNLRPLVTIYDAGGIDTIDLSIYAAGPQILDLRGGSYSDVLGMVNNLAIAFTTLIENGIGGQGDDVVRGNDAANGLWGNDGNDTLYGGSGGDELHGDDGIDALFGENGIDVIDGGANNDFIDGGGTGLSEGTETLTGGAGEDTFVYSYAYLGTLITDFSGVEDYIDISKQKVNNFVDLMALATQQGLDTVIDFGVSSFNNLHDLLTLQNFNIDDLDSSRFTFVESEISAPADFTIIQNPAIGRTFYSTGAAFSDGYMVVETSLTTYDGSHALMAHRFNEIGLETGTFQVNTTAFTNSGLYARALTLSNGNVAVIWMSDDTGGGGDFCFRGRIFDENGVPVTENDFVINSTPPVTQINPNGWSMDILDLSNSTSGNGFIVGWRKDIAPGDESYQTHYFQRAFDNNGTAVTEDIDVGAIGMPDVPGIPLQTALREMVLSNGNVLHWWSDFVPGDASGTVKIMARFSGQEAFVVVADNPLSQPVSVDELSNGNIVFTWTKGSISGSSYYVGGAQSVILDEDLHGFVRPGTIADETITGGIYNDELYGLAGNDTLIGGRDGDRLDGGDGIDTVDYSGSIKGVILSLGSTAVQQGGHAEGDTFISIENVIGSGAGDIFYDDDADDNHIFGNYGKDFVYMGGGNNTIDGGRGADTIAFDGEVTDFEFTYDPFNKIITITPKDAGSPYGVNAISNVETFTFGVETFTLKNILARAGYNDDNHPATAIADTYQVNVDEAFSSNAERGLLSNDDIPDGGGIIVGILWDGDYVMSVDDPERGKLTLEDDGGFTYIPPAGLGSHTFEYRMEDLDGSWSTSTVTFNVTLPPPDAVDDYYTIEKNGSIFMVAAEGLLANDDPVSGTASIVGLVNGDDPILVDTLHAEGGTLHVNANGSFDFTADADYRGYVSFRYAVMSDSTADDRAKVTFVVLGDNVAPNGTNNVITIAEDEPYTIETEDFGFRDGINNFLSVHIDTIFGDGTLTLDGAAVAATQDINVSDFAKLVWTPGKDKSGTDLGGFTFRVRDDGGSEGDDVDMDWTANTMKFDVTPVTDVFKGKKSNDTFVGTDDHDVFDGKKGNDSYTGNDGSDKFIFKKGYEKDTILDFDAQGDDHDVIDIRFLLSVSNYKDLKQHHLEEHGNSVWIDGGKGDVLILKNVEIDDISKVLFQI